MIKSASIAAVALLVLGLAPVSSAQAAGSASKPPPNPCRTFTDKSADKLFGVHSSTHLPEKLTTFGTGEFEYRLCTVRHRHRQLLVTTERVSGGSGGPFKCYKRPKLGSHGKVCVTDKKGFSDTSVSFKKHGIFFSDNYNLKLRRKGAKLYSFALAQYKAYKG
jgi:hypothetical protein